MPQRKIIFKCTIGSKLYGTDGPDSDTDYSGVFLPSAEDLLGIGNCPTEWTENVKVSEGPRNGSSDVDCKYYSLPRFLDLASQGQPGQLEMLFVPEYNVHIRTPEWDQILANRNLFIAKSGIKPFIGFALAQAHKAEIKGENLNLLRSLQMYPGSPGQVLSTYRCYDYILFPVGLNSFQKLPITRNEHGFEIIEVAGRKFDLNIKVNSFLVAVGKLVDRYGTRAEAAAAQGQDYKSLSHAYRLIWQADEFLRTGYITLPSPRAASIRQIKLGQYEKTNYREEIEQMLDELRLTLQSSPLPDGPDRSRIRQLCIDIQQEHLR